MFEFFTKFITDNSNSIPINDNILIVPFLLSLLLLLTGLLGVLKNKNNILIIFIFLEVCLLSISLIFIFGSNLLYFNNNVGQIVAIFVLTLAAAESCIGLSLLIVFFKLKGSINTNNLNSLIG